MSKEELMRPRYKVIAGYPDSHYTIGTILDRNWCRYENDDEETGKIIWQLSDFPHLFKRLEWWEERPIEDMPIYVKHRSNVYQVDRWCGSFQNKCWVGCYLKGDGVYFIYSHELTTATAAEYEQYINQKENQ